MRLVYTGIDGGLYVWGGPAGAAARITWPWEERDAHGTRTALCYGWPTCAPDGLRVLALARRGSDRHFVYVVETSGVLAEEVLALGEAAPIYANWSPDGRRVAVLVQRKETLSLELVELATAAPPRTVARGAPLFWSWSPDATTVAVHCGQSARDVSEGGTFLVDAASGAVRESVSAVPAPYRAPSWSADGRWLAFARLAESGTRLVLIDCVSGERRTRALERGPVAFIWHPRLPILAYAIATDETPHVYHRVVTLDLAEDRERAIDRPTLACCWHPARAALFRLAIDARREALLWEGGDAGNEMLVLARFAPTRETVFVASFFDQYATSHAPIAPDGTALAIAGRLAEDTSDGAPRVYVVPTDGGGASVAVGEGVSPVWTAPPVA